MTAPTPKAEDVKPYGFMFIEGYTCKHCGNTLLSIYGFARQTGEDEPIDKQLSEFRACPCRLSPPSA